MKKEKLFNFTRIILIILIVSLLIFIIFPLLWTSLSGTPNEYTKASNVYVLQEI